MNVSYFPMVVSTRGTFFISLFIFTKYSLGEMHPYKSFFLDASVPSFQTRKGQYFVLGQLPKRNGFCICCFLLLYAVERNMPLHVFLTPLCPVFKMKRSLILS
jgi:hypothetical protein